jgi:hypothetical protein
MSKEGRAHAGRFAWSALAPEVERAYAAAVEKRGA